MVGERDSRAIDKPTGRRTADALTGAGNDAHLIFERARHLPRCDAGLAYRNGRDP